MNTATLLRSIPFFSHIPQDQMTRLTAQTKLIQLACGDPLMRQGELEGHAYVLLDGRLQTTVRSALGKEVVIGEISSGEIVGETAALLEQPRSATVKAMRDSVLLQVDRSDLLALIRGNDEALLAFSRMMVRRAQPTFAHHSAVKSILLFPITPRFPLERLAMELAAAIENTCTVAVVDRATFVSESGLELGFDEGGENSMEMAPAIGQGLAKLEAGQAFTIYVADGGWDAWARACSGRVDRIILLAMADDHLPQGPSERALATAVEKTNHVKTELILVHKVGAPAPSHTQRWLADRDIFRHHHVEEDSKADIQRLVRFLTGQSIGLALSGGGFKSSMQAGIMHAMVESGIPLDILGGSSGGAFAGAVFANRPPLHKIPALVAEGMERFRKVAKLTFPMVSLYTGSKITQGFKDFFGETDLEDLWINYFCLSLSLISGDLIVHRRGPLWEAVRASASVMGLFPPVMTNGDVLVDGGFINPCPTDVLHRLGAGKIIVVSAFGKAGISTKGDFPPSISGWSLLLRSLNPFNRQKIAPKIGTSIVQSMLFASTYLLSNVFDKSRIDLFIEPDMSKYSAQDQDAVQKMYEIGYEYGTRHSAEWKATLHLT